MYYLHFFEVIFMDYVKNILNYVKQQGVSDKDLCILLERNQSYISDWKSGKSKPKVEDIIRIADRFGVDINILLGYPVDNAGLNKYEQQLLDDFRSLSDQGKEYILQTMDLAVSRYKKDNSVSKLENIG